MKKLMLRQALALVAILASSAGMAATVTVTASTLAPTVGQNFTMTLSGDLPNVFAATIEMSFDPTKVAYVSGIGLGAFTVFVKNSTPETTPTVINIEVPAGSVSGQQDYALLTFQMLAAGAANIVFSDDGGTASGWPDFTTSEPIIANYVQANVVFCHPDGSPCPPPIPAPPAIWLLLTGIAGLGGRRWLRRKATA